MAEKGKGTNLNNSIIKVINETSLSSVLVACQIDGHQENPKATYQEGRLLAEIILNIRNLRVSNCTPLDAAWVCKGKYGATLNKGSKVWDNVAQQIIIEEAGGICTDFYGKPLDYSNILNRTKENFTYCAAPKELHQQLQQIIHSLEI